MTKKKGLTVINMVLENLEGLSFTECGSSQFVSLLSCIRLCCPFNPTALRRAKTQSSFSRSECRRVAVLTG